MEPPWCNSGNPYVLPAVAASLSSATMEPRRTAARLCSSWYSSVHCQTRPTKSSTPPGLDPFGNRPTSPQRLRCHETRISLHEAASRPFLLHRKPKANTLAFACGAGTASSHHHFPHGYVRSGSPACAVSRRRKLWAGYYSLKHEQDEAPKMGLCNILPFPFSGKPLAVEGAWHRRGYVKGSPQRANAMDCVGRFVQLSRRTLRHPDGSPQKERAPASCVRPPLLRAAWRRPPAFWPYREAPSSLSGWYNPSGARSCLSRPDGFSD